MECRAFLLLAWSTMMATANPVNDPGCTLEPVRSDQEVKVFYTTSRVTRGCVGRGPTDPNLEVHILNLRFSNSPQKIQFHVNASAAKEDWKVVFVVNSNVASALDMNTEVYQLSLRMKPNKPEVITFSKEINTTTLSLSSEELLDWAKTTYGDISSFTELDDPQKIHFQVGRDSRSSKDCIPENNFNAEQYLEAEFVSNNTKSCQGSTVHPGKVAHIVWLQETPPDSGNQTVALNIKVACSDGKPAEELTTLLVLKSHQKMLWNIDETPQLVKFMVSGKYSIKKMGSIPISGVALPDSREGLIKEAHGKDFGFIASYTEVPSAKSITLEVVRICGEKTEGTTAPPSWVPDMTNMVQHLIKLCHPWKCTDNTIEIALPKGHLTALKAPITKVTLQDPSCTATDNTTHFVLKRIVEDCFTRVEGGIHVKNQLVLTLPSLPDKVMVPFECDLPEKVFVQLYQTPDFSTPAPSMVEVNDITYVQVSVQTADENSPLRLQDCFLQTPGQTAPQKLISAGKPMGSSVEILNSPSAKTHRFSFVYRAAAEGRSSLPATLVCQVYPESQLHDNHSYEGSIKVVLKNPASPSHSLGIGTVLGITFGAFLIGVMLTAALWYIYSHTRPTAKMQPVSANPPASESSSTNHSIGSTQSTPCSTSSMA